MWLLSPSGWPTYAPDNSDAELDLLDRGYAPIDTNQVAAAVAAYQAGSPAPVPQDPLTEAEAAAAVQGGTGPLALALRAALETGFAPSLLRQQYPDIAAASTPDDLPGLALWFKADALALADGAAVATWADASGNTGRDATQGTAGNRPVCKTNQLGGKPVVRFSAAASQHLTVPYGGEPGTIIVVGKQNTAGVFAAFCGAKGSEQGFAEAWTLRAQRGNPHWQAEFARADRRTSGTDDVTQFLAAQQPIPTGAFNLYMGTLDVGTRTLAFYRDGHAQRVQTTRSLGHTAAAMLIGAGWSYHAPGEFLDGDIAEIIQYDRELSPSELNVVGRYLADKYGIAYTPVASPPLLDTPLLLASFHYDERNQSNTLYLLGSAGGVAWRSINGPSPVYTNPNGQVKDCSIRRDDADGCFYVLHSDAPSAGSTFGLVRYDPHTRTSTRLGGISMAALAGVTNVWAPEWFEDFDGSLHVLFTGSTDNMATSNCYETHPLDDTLTTWSAPVNLTNGALGGSPIDFFVLRFVNTYYMWFKAAGPYVATASALTGPWTVTHSGNWGGWSTPNGNGYEGPSLVRHDGKWLLYADDGHLKVSTTTNDFAEGPFTDFVPVTFEPSTLPPMNHGTVIRI